jgi:hypothetical protein
MAKYGEESFTLEIIDFADTYDELKEKEKYWIKWYNSTDKCSDKQKEHLSKLQEQCKTKVYQYSKTGEFIAEYDSIIEACKANGLSRNTIRIQLKNPPRNPNDHRIKFLWKTVKTERY